MGTERPSQSLFHPSFIPRLSTPMSSSSNRMPSWPPSLTQIQLSELSSSSTDYALSHGLVYRPPVTSSESSPSTSSVIHAPFSLLPSPFPKHLFENANNLQPAFNFLYSKIALDDQFLERVIGGSVVKVDEFQRGLWDVWNRCRQNDISQVSLRKDFGCKRWGRVRLRWERRGERGWR